MPKKPIKNPPKKGKKTQPKNQPKPVSITSSKLYWLTLTVAMLIFGAAYTFMMKITLPATALLMADVLLFIGFAYHLKFSASTLKTMTRATYIFVGASVIGFSIWAAAVLILGAIGFWTQVGNQMNINYFSATTLIVALILGAFIGDWLGKHNDKITFFLHDKFGA